MPKTSFAHAIEKMLRIQPIEETAKKRGHCARPSLGKGDEM